MINFDFLESDSEKIDFIQSVGNMIVNDEITPEKLNETLANYWQVSRYLITLYESVSLEYEQMKLDYDCWYAETFIDCKATLNEDRSKSKFASTSEIHQFLVANNIEEYRKKQNVLITAEKRRSFYAKLLDNWKANSQMIIQISQNMRTELLSLSTERKANEDLTNEKIIRKVKKIRN